MRLLTRTELKKCANLGLISGATVKITEDGFTPVFQLNDNEFGVSNSRKIKTMVSFKRLSSCERLIKIITTSQHKED